MNSQQKNMDSMRKPASVRSVCTQKLCSIPIHSTNECVKKTQFTEPEPDLNGRKIFHPRGKVVGGITSINAMI